MRSSWETIVGGTSPALRTPVSVRCRPFYAEYAWAFDLLIDRPVEKECAVIVAWLVGRGILPGAEILDAGCGTGRYSRELARRGYIVHGVDGDLQDLFLEKIERLEIRSKG
jgi:2-polyprenyl-3-methyl-5-hydroxy-6-metoxy-1,4-benzoquinol methylase